MEWALPGGSVTEDEIKSGRFPPKNLWKLVMKAAVLKIRNFSLEFEQKITKVL